jgi:hypothetical protein
MGTADGRAGGWVGLARPPHLRHNDHAIAKMTRLTSAASHVNRQANKKVLSRDSYVNDVATQDKRGDGGN